MGRFTSMLLGSILVLFSLAAFTHGQESSEQNINILRKILSDDVDILTELNLLDDEEENGDSGDMLPLQMGDLNAIPEQKRFCGMSTCGRGRRRRKRPAKRLFCNFGGCYSGKRSTHTRPRFV
uniref:Uncharacterized protein LOC111101385 n=1 Tax=Crassostrea virginica TaxID=6565 RepID=A0A8B8AGB8_CRAVI|nr:uncharacterized protein LOC111101385 [Crassostrea virginica]|mmetsp:Transcript_27823/g.44537  ORF Transcript_27823/g.44537 Transcript_27823/m.44537 type:complete len:123 (+) Transcript_27823:65-433(+)